MPEIEKRLPTLADAIPQQGIADAAGGSTYTGLTESEAAGDVAFGGPTADFILYGVVNGAFAQGPPDSTQNIEPVNNPLPYWSGPTQVSGGAITCQWVTDASSPSGQNLRFTVNPGAASDEAYVEQIVPIGGNRGRAGGELVAYSGKIGATTTFDVKVVFQYLDITGATTGAATTLIALPSAPNSDFYGYGDPISVVPTSSAAYLRIRVGVARSAAAASATGTVDFSDIRRITAVKSVFLADIDGSGSYPPAQLYQSTSTAVLSSYRSGARGQVQVNPLGASMSYYDGSATGSLTVSTGLTLATTINPTLSANQNDWSPTGIGTAMIIDASVTGATRTITGIDATGSSVGRTLWITATTNAIILAHASASSTTTNRILCAGAADLTIRQGGGVQLLRISNSGDPRWKTITV